MVFIEMKLKIYYLAANCSMQTSLHLFLNKFYGQEAIDSLILLTGSASSRGYYRFIFEGKSMILTISTNIEENEAFFYFTKLLSECTHAVPKLGFVSDDRTIYSQEDLGPTSLLDVLLSDRTKAKRYYEDLIPELIKCQIYLGKTVDFDKAFSYPELDDTMVLRDLFQFKFYFLNALDIRYHQGKLIQDFKRLANCFIGLAPQGFVFRDFQSRNIMIRDEQPFFIDYQGGLKGCILYDLVALIWQAKADFSADDKRHFYAIYSQELLNLQPLLDAKTIEKAYEYCVIIRLFQVLGTYGFRGLIEKKTHFIESIAFGLLNLAEIKDFALLNDFPELKQVIDQLIDPTINEQIKLKING